MYNFPIEIRVIEQLRFTAEKTSEQMVLVDFFYFMLFFILRRIVPSSLDGL